MVLADVGTWVGVVVAVVAIGVPILLAQIIRERRFRSSVQYRVEACFEAAKLFHGFKATNRPLDDEVRLTLGDRVSALVDALSEDASLVQRQLRRVKKERPERMPERLYHLMTTEMLWRAQKKPFTDLDVLFIFLAGSVAVLLIDAPSLRDEAVGMLALSESRADEYEQAVKDARQEGRSPPSMADAEDRTLPWVFFRLVIANLFPTKVQQRIADAKTAQIAHRARGGAPVGSPV